MRIEKKTGIRSLIQNEIITYNKIKKKFCI